MLGKNSTDEVKQYIDSIITCAKPNPKKPHLHCPNWLQNFRHTNVINTASRHTKEMDGSIRNAGLVFRALQNQKFRSMTSLTA